jgi:hypothetical protein
MRYSKRVSLGTPPRKVRQMQGAPARVDIERVKVALAIIGAVCFFGLFALFLISGR